MSTYVYVRIIGNISYSLPLPLPLPLPLHLPLNLTFIVSRSSAALPRSIDPVRLAASPTQPGKSGEPCIYILYSKLCSRVSHCHLVISSSRHHGSNTEAIRG